MGNPLLRSWKPVLPLSHLRTLPVSGVKNELIISVVEFFTVSTKKKKRKTRIVYKKYLNL